jgi:NNP family nitrate/nitrite transporter-like MFS transporter
MPDDGQSRYKWLILALLAAIGTFVSTMPFSSMPALFKEISDDLGLDLVQIGAIWGISNLAGIFVSLIAGVLGDRFGVKRTLFVCCILAGITGALRGLADSFTTLAVIVFINGIVRMVVPIGLTKGVGAWFAGPRLGMAMGIQAMGMGLGLMLGPMLSATVLSPLLGGWRGVMYLYGGVSIVMGLVWQVFGRESPQTTGDGIYTTTVPFRQSLSVVVHLKEVWLLGLVLMFRSGCIMGLTGYVPLYLRGRGWETASADGALAAFYAVSTLSVVPLSFLSDRLGSRKAILFAALVVGTACVGLLPFVDGASVWVLMVLCGMYMDGFMSIGVVMVLENKGVGREYSGTALGLVFTIMQIGNVIAPPLGNSFDATWHALPFIFWAGLSVIALLFLLLVRETATRKAALAEPLVVEG